MHFLASCSENDVIHSRLWGALYAFLPTITSMHLCEAPLMRPKFHQYLICREIPIVSSRCADYPGCVGVCGGAGSQLLSWGGTHKSTFSLQVVDFPDR